MAAGHYSLFEATFGRCGLAWTERGLRAVSLPGSSDNDTCTHLLARRPGLQRADSDWPAFVDQAAAARAIDPGPTCTYGDMAQALGEPAAMRAVGQALGHNPWPLVVPCHRVLAAGGKLGGFSAPGGSPTKRRLLALEASMVRCEDELF